MGAKGLGEHIRLAGWLNNEQIRDEIANSRALVLPSFAEGLPVVIMESLALARPVISTYVAGIPELVDHGVSGILVPPGNPTALADAIEQILQSPDTAEKMENWCRDDRNEERPHSAIGNKVLAALVKPAHDTCGAVDRSLRSPAHSGREHLQVDQPRVSRLGGSSNLDRVGM